MRHKPLILVVYSTLASRIRFFVQYCLARLRSNMHEKACSCSLCMKIASNTRICHSERSEESLAQPSNAWKSRSFASLRMTTWVIFISWGAGGKPACVIPMKSGMSHESSLTPSSSPSSFFGNVPEGGHLLQAGHIHVWRAIVDVPFARLQVYQETLSPDEQARAQRFKIIPTPTTLYGGTGNPATYSRSLPPDISPGHPFSIGSLWKNRFCKTSSITLFILT